MAGIYRMNKVNTMDPMNGMRKPHDCPLITEGTPYLHYLQQKCSNRSGSLIKTYYLLHMYIAALAAPATTQ